MYWYSYLSTAFLGFGGLGTWTYLALASLYHQVIHMRIAPWRSISQILNIRWKKKVAMILHIPSLKNPIDCSLMHPYQRSSFNIKQTSFEGLSSGLEAFLCKLHSNSTVLILGHRMLRWCLTTYSLNIEVHAHQKTLYKRRWRGKKREKSVLQTHVSPDDWFLQSNPERASLNRAARVPYKH